MGATKRDFQELIQKYYSEEEMYYACLGDVKTQYANEDCDISPKDIE
mgnify:FL=1|jgi:hypothetical protein|tara:strand:- start:1023 stop:1163 length:141 start_codon:yes stop_codon:yes gene_type:complete